MAQYRLAEGLYILPTPAGAYYSVSGPELEPSRRLLRALIRQPKSHLLTSTNLRTWTGDSVGDAGLELLYHAQSLGWVEGHAEQQIAPTGALEDVLPRLLPSLSSSGKALLADSQGFYVDSQGFPHETAEELSAASADLASLHERHHKLLRNNLGLWTSAWALVDAAGNSQIGFWPLYIGTQRFVLIIGGVPRLNNPALTHLIWSLNMRYDE